MHVNGMKHVEFDSSFSTFRLSPLSLLSHGWVHICNASDWDLPRRESGWLGDKSPISGRLPALQAFPDEKHTSQISMRMMDDSSMRQRIPGQGSGSGRRILQSQDFGLRSMQKSDLSQTSRIMNAAEIGYLRLPFLRDEYHSKGMFVSRQMIIAVVLQLRTCGLLNRP